MNIGFDGSRAFIDKKTGTENYSYQLLYHLSKIDHTNNYYIYLRPGQVGRGGARRVLVAAPAGSETSEDGRRETEATGPRYYRWPENFKFITLPYPRLWTQIGLGLQTFKDPLDVLFIPSHTLPIIRNPKLKTVLTVHDLGAEYLPKTHQLKQRFYLNYMTHQQLKSATQLIAVSQSTKNDLVNAVGIDPEKISVIYEGYNKQLYKPVSKEIQRSILKEFDIEPQNYFLFVGTIQPRKNIERLIKAYSLWLQRRPKSELNKVSDDEEVKLVLVGSRGWLVDEIYELPQKLGIADKVKFLGYVEDSKMPALYCGAQALLFPSLFEGFGLPVLEAMACGCPVLTSKTSSLPEVAGKAALLVDPYSVEEIAEGIERVQGAACLPARQGCRVQLEKAGLKQVEKFSWEKTAQETLRLLLST